MHGTTSQAWKIIQEEGLSKMKRNHIHLAQGVGGDNVISGASLALIPVLTDQHFAHHANLSHHVLRNEKVFPDPRIH